MWTTGGALCRARERLCSAVRLVSPADSADEHSRAGCVDRFARFGKEAVASDDHAVCTLDSTLNGNDPPLAVGQGVGVRMDEDEMRPFNQNAVVVRRQMLNQAIGIRARRCDRYAVIEVKFAGPAVVIKPVSNVRILLEL